MIIDHAAPLPPRPLQPWCELWLMAPAWSGASGVLRAGLGWGKPEREERRRRESIKLKS